MLYERSSVIFLLTFRECYVGYLPMFQVQRVRELLRGTSHALIGGSYLANYLAVRMKCAAAEELTRKIFLIQSVLRPCFSCLEDDIENFWREYRDVVMLSS